MQHYLLVMAKIVVDSGIPFIRDRFPENTEVVYLPGNEFTPEIVKDADAIIVRTRTKCDKNLLEGSNVRLVSTATIGTDHIDISWCEKNNITVRNAPGCNAPGVAQYVFASLFKTGFNPENQTLGIIGYGNVGHVVADWATQLGIKTLICDPPRNEKGFQDIVYHDLDYVLKNSDAVTIHVPFTKNGKYPTFGLIGKKELEQMKCGAILVNSSRGGVVKEKDLKPFLREGKINTIIDVWEYEPEIDGELVNLASIATPHIAGYSAEGKRRATQMALKGISSILDIPVILDGLDCKNPNEIKISRKLIEDSYDPIKDHRMLASDISRFEKIRDHYQYRHEPDLTN